MKLFLVWGGRRRLDVGIRGMVGINKGVVGVGVGK